MDAETRSRVENHLKKAEAKLRSARILAQSGEADDAVSRAYYAAFHAARAALAALGFSPKTHDGLISLFGAHLADTGRIDRRLGRSLNRLQDDRENGDYGLQTFFDAEDAGKAIRQAEDLLKAVRAWLAAEFGAGPESTPSA